MISIDIELVKKVQMEFEDEIKIHYTNALSNLHKIQAQSQEDDNYLKCMINFFESDKYFLFHHPVNIAYLANLFPAVPRQKRKNGDMGRYRTKIKDDIVEALGYDKLRADFYPKYFLKIGIKACVFCNSALTVSIDTTDPEGVEKVKAKFQVDHYFPKADYPILSISLFNLYPSCASCNNVKNDKLVKFNLYSSESNDLIKSPFSFKLSPFDQVKYMLGKGEIDFYFEEPKIDENIYSSFNKTFDIKGIYDTQKDLLEELITKSQVYNSAYKNNLKNNFPKLFITDEQLDRFILGNYPHVQDIHKRPMAKFMQDIARDLNLID